MKLSHSILMCSLATVSALGLSSCANQQQSSLTESHISAVSAVDCGGSYDLRGAGSTAQVSAIEQFGYAYTAACPGYALKYTANGSMAGIDNFIANKADLAGSDVPLTSTSLQIQQEKLTEHCGSPAWNLPLVFDPIAITYRIPGVTTLNLDGVTLAKIFSGTIDMWDHPSIKALNEGISLPSLPIHIIYRADRSSSTAALQKYFEWVTSGGWGGGVTETFTGYPGEAVTSSNAVATALQETEGSIGYSEWSFAVSKQLPIARVVTEVGADPVAITPDSVGKTIAGAKFSGQGNDLVLDTTSFYKTGNNAAYPIVLTTYEIVCSKYPDPATGTAVRAFMQATLGSAQEGLDQYGAIPLPDKFKEKIRTAVDAIR